MSDRFFIETPVTAPHAVLHGAEAHHLAHVLRAQVGDEVLVFDGSGAEFLARLAAVKKNTVELTVLERREIHRELPRELVLAVALPKGERQKWLVEKATELGAKALVPLITERGVAQPTDSALERLRRWVIEATKQCGRNRLLEIREPVDLGALARQAPAEAIKLVAHPGAARTLGEVAGSSAARAASSVLAAVGPEGGFTEAEVAQLLAAGWQAVALGPTILRVETAALQLVAVLGAGPTEVTA